MTGVVGIAPHNVIFGDHSTLSTFATCREKGRLAYVEHLQPRDGSPPLVFGSAFHAAVAAFYNACAQHIPTEAARNAARKAFLKEVREEEIGRASCRER